MKPATLSFLPAAVWFIFSSVLFFLPGDKLPPEDLFALPGIDKLVHSCIFFVLCLLMYLPFRKVHNASYKKTAFIRIAFAATAYGILVEFIQMLFIANRSFDLWDMCFDALGCLLACLLGISYPLRNIKK